jgi:hypothetical protein
VSADRDDDEFIQLPSEQDVASTGAAADSAWLDEKLKTLPRLLRYVILSDRETSFAAERLIAEITELYR